MKSYKLKLLNKNLETFTLPTFLNSFFNQYIIDYLNQDICYGGKAKQRIFLNQNALTEYRDDKDDPDSVTEICNTPDGIGGNPDIGEYSIKCPGQNSERRCSMFKYGTTTSITTTTTTTATTTTAILGPL